MIDFLSKPTPHAEAIAFIASKTPVSKEVFLGMLPELRARAIAVSGITSFDVLQRVRDEISTLPSGADWKDARKNIVEEIHPFLADPEDPENTNAAERRAETLLRTHGFQASQAASFRNIDAQKEIFPFVEYHSMDDDRVRGNHAALDGLIFPFDSAFVQGHWCPWDYGCRCHWVPINADDAHHLRKGEAKLPPEERTVVEGALLNHLETTGHLMIGPNRITDLRTPQEKEGPSAYAFNPRDLHIPVERLRERYDEPTWATFEKWSRNTPIGEAASLSVWDWMNGKRLPEQPDLETDFTGKTTSINYDKQHGKDAEKIFQKGGKIMQAPATLSQSLSASDLNSRGADLATSAEQPLRALSSDRPRDYLLESTHAEIDREDIALIEWAKAHNRFLTAEEVAKFEDTPGLENVGNKEHDVWKVETPKGAFMIRRTKNGAYGLKFRSPFQYLQRMADVSALVPEAPIEFLGVSQSKQGAGAIWTVQPYIEGGHPSDKQLASWLKKEGWIQRDDRPHRYYQHGATGMKIHDLHAGNCIMTSHGIIIPIDVFFEGVE